MWGAAHRATAGAAGRVGQFVIFLAILAILAVPALAAAMACALLVRLLCALRRGTPWPALTVATCVQASLGALCLAVTAFAWGHLTGFGETWAPRPACSENAFGLDEEPRRVLLTESVFPVSVVCAEHPGDPHAVELVGGWVNPAVVAGAAVTLLGLLLAPFANRLRASGLRRRAVRRRRARRRADERAARREAARPEPATRVWPPGGISPTRRSNRWSR